ncbi:MAG: hypothetical protein ACKO2T_08000, partial [Microcystis aeruginosa]
SIVVRYRVLGFEESGVRSQEIGDYFIYSPYTPHPTPHTLHPTPHTPPMSGGLGGSHPTPHTLHPTPYTLPPGKTFSADPIYRKSHEQARGLKNDRVPIIFINIAFPNLMRYTKILTPDS